MSVFYLDIDKLYTTTVTYYSADGTLDARNKSDRSHLSPIHLLKETIATMKNHFLDVPFQSTLRA